MAAGKSKTKKLIKDLRKAQKRGLPHKKYNKIIMSYVNEALDNVSLAEKSGFIAGIGTMLLYISERETGLFSDVEALTVFLWERHIKMLKEDEPESLEIAEYPEYKEHFWKALIYWSENV
ncbi:hypothetical protein [Clostridium tyrobutyricum]|uniref:hypothetical protein n=1 Tax=Clostridium tyrobutyricum TaxID=1519 RepID=UPI0030CCD421